MVRYLTPLRRLVSLIGRYPELRELKIRQLARKLLSLDSDFTLQSLKKEIENYTSGQLPHATHVITALYELMESDEPIEEIPILVAAPTHQQAPSGDWIGLKKALTSSLTSGTFLDSQFYAVESRSSTGLPKIRPMYFCSLVGGDFVSRLMKCKPPAHIACGWAADSSF